jgi:hypoxanthine phosphoribosyltransferase
MTAAARPGLPPHHVNEILHPRGEIAARVGEIARAIREGLQSEDFVMLGVLRGSFMFFADLCRALHEVGVHPRIDFLTLESYGKGTTSGGVPRVTKDLSVDIGGADVLLVDDILDTGRTLRFAVQHIRNKGAASVRTCTLLDKPARRRVDIEADLVGFTVEDRFVVGYGLDYDAHYRELPHIAAVTFLESPS